MSRAIALILTILSLFTFALAQTSNQSDRSEVEKRVYNAAYRASEASSFVSAQSLLIAEFKGAVVSVSGSDKDVLVITNPKFTEQTASRLFSDTMIGSDYFRMGFARVRITNGRETWEAMPTKGRWLQSGAEVTAENCCTSLEQEEEYCKAWAAGTGHAKISYSHAYAEGHDTNDVNFGYCPKFLVNHTDGITPEEKQKAEAVIAQDNARVAEEFNAKRCSAQDSRPVYEQNADPICIARYQQQEIEQQKRTERQIKEAELRQKEHDQAISRLGIRDGQTQAEVKVQLATDGFRMPWQCAGDWSQNVGVSISGDWEWIAGCSTQRSRRDGGNDNIKVYFSVYRRVRHVDADTGAGNIVDQKTDKLLLINYDGK